MLAPRCVDKTTIIEDDLGRRLDRLESAQARSALQGTTAQKGIIEDDLDLHQRLDRIELSQAWTRRRSRKTTIFTVLTEKSIVSVQRRPEVF